MRALLDVALLKLPVLAGRVDAGEETLLLLLIGDVQEEFGDVDAVAVGVGLVVGDVLETVFEEALQVGGGLVRQALNFGDNLRVDAADQHLLIVAAVEDAEAAARGHDTQVTPEEVVVQLVGGGALEGVGLDALGVHAGHDVLDGGVLAGGVHGLEDEQHGVAVLRVHFLLEVVDLRAELGDEFLVVSIVPVEALDFGLRLLDAEVFAFGDSEVFEIELEFHGRDGVLRC